MELKTSEVMALEPIKFNYEELKQQLIEKVSTYKNLVYSEENIKEAKSDRASLNKLAKAFADERKRIKNQLLEPYIDFENKCKELETIIDEASKSIDTQVKAFEEKEDLKKKQEIIGYFITVVGEFSEVLDFDLIFNERWLNKTFSMDKVQQDIDHIIMKTKQDMECIDGQVSDIELKKQVKAFYFKNINNSSILSMSLQEAKRIDETNEKINNLENSSVKVEENIASSEAVAELRFSVWCTAEQADKLKRFLLENKIKVRKI